MYDLAIVGGGMSGISAAIAAASRGKKVIIIEKNKKLGRKLYATGNGRCNITNSFISYDKNYNSHSDDYVEFLTKALGESPFTLVEDFISMLKIKTKTINGYVYPLSLQASSFVWTLIDKLNELNAEVLLNQTVTSIQKNDLTFSITTDKDNITAKNVLLATGSSSYPDLGGSDYGYILAKDMNIDMINPRPALCSLRTKEKIEVLMGVRCNCVASLCTKDNIISKETGELQFTKDSLSGILIFNLSSKCGSILDKGNRAYISIDLISDYDKDYIVKDIAACNRNILAFLNTYINDKMAAYILDMLQIDKKAIASSLTDDTANILINALKNLRFEIVSTNDFSNAQVAAGGIKLEELNYDFSAKKINGLYVTGELADIDGLCGGYNITFAILSGLKAGSAI